jgi:YVTN family beta-propeller protein
MLVILAMKKPMSWPAKVFQRNAYKMKKMIFTGFVLTGSLFAAPTFACTPPPAHPEYLLVGNKGDDSISFLNLETGREVSRRPVSAKAPHEIAIAGQFAAVVNYGSASVDIFNIAFKFIETTIDLGENKNPHGIIALKNGGFVATTEGVILSPNHDFSKFGSGPCPTYDWNVESIPTGQEGTHMIAVTPDERLAFTANLRSGTVSQIDLKTKQVKSVPAGKEVEGIAVTKDGKEVWASVRGENKVIVYDALSLSPLAEIPVGAFPLRILLSPDGKHMVTSNLMDGTISVINVATRTVERTIKVSGRRETAQVTLLFSKDGRRLYAAETGINKIAEIDFETGDLIGRLSAGSQGDGLAIVPASP